MKYLKTFEHNNYQLLDKLNIVKELLKNPNIDINIQDRNGQTAIFKAAIKASNLVNVWKINDSIYLKTIKELLKHPIDIKIKMINIFMII